MAYKDTVMFRVERFCVVAEFESLPPVSLSDRELGELYLRDALGASRVTVYRKNGGGWCMKKIE